VKFVELRNKCFGTFDVTEDVCQDCPIRVDCETFEEYECSDKFNYITVKCGECVWRVFCKEKSSGQELIRQKPSLSVLGVDPAHADEYEQEDDRIKEELRAKRDPW
jgi:hypothetical protein